ncbi:hypothetical protein QBC42DRAFT_311700 [Cladorrhinum samala]|uniref:Uncharacterized protein n=1 Tax=Cladorrhinum samala TaxID=585594 RepID=A0AAV9I0T5_9PEZI|nr:hypothetical protein QBC42DRAFT_311700 [Cladorrhinum samala]
MCIQRTRNYTCEPGVNHTITYRHFCSSPPPHGFDGGLNRCFDHECEADLDWVTETYAAGEMCPDCTGGREHPVNKPIAVVSSKVEVPNLPADRAAAFRKFPVELYKRRLCRLLWAWFNIPDVSGAPILGHVDYPPNIIRENIGNWIKDDLAIVVSESICPVTPEHGMYQWISNLSPNPEVLDFNISYSYNHWKDCACIPIAEPRLVNPAKWLRLRMAQQLLQSQLWRGQGQDYLLSLAGFQNACLGMYKNNAARLTERTGRSARAAHYYLPVYEYDREAMADRKQKLEAYAESLFAGRYQNDPVMEAELTEDQVGQLKNRYAVASFACLLLAADTGLTLERATEILHEIMEEAVKFNPHLESTFVIGSVEHTAGEKLYMSFTCGSPLAGNWGTAIVFKMWNILNRKTESRWNRFVERDDWRVNLIKQNLKYASADDMRELTEAAERTERKSLTCQICWSEYEEHDSVLKTPCRLKKCDEARRACWYTASCYIKSMRAKYHPELERLPARCTSCTTALEDFDPGEPVKDKSVDPRSSGLFEIWTT